MHTRRRFLRRLLSSTALAALVPAGLAIAAHAAPAHVAPGRFFIVNGWVLTEADMRMLGHHAP